MGGYGRRHWAGKNQSYLIYCLFFGGCFRRLFVCTVLVGELGGGKLVIRGEILSYVQVNKVVVELLMLTTSLY